MLELPPRRQNYVVELRKTLTLPGIEAVFFDWSERRRVTFVDPTRADQRQVLDLMSGDEFKDLFGAVDTEEFEQINLS
jgi:hypothetical protein